MAEENKLQEQAEQTKPEQDKGGAGENEGAPEITLESLMAEMAKLKAENAKNKTALDKALHNNGELTKQLRAKMTASEQEEEAKREAEEAQKNRIKDLENYKAKSEARERYMTTIGMTPELAKEAAEAEVAGDMDALASVYKRHQEAALKAHEAEWLKKRPLPAAGREESKDEEDPFLKGFNNASY